MSSLPRVLVVLNTKFNVLEKYLKGSDNETLRIYNAYLADKNVQLQLSHATS